VSVDDSRLQVHHVIRSDRQRLDLIARDRGASSSGLRHNPFRLISIASNETVVDSSRVFVV
jgi:hypothetical protein